MQSVVESSVNVQTSNVTNRIHLGIAIGSRVHNTTDPPEFKLSIGKYEGNSYPNTYHNRQIRFRPVRVRPIKSPRPVSWNQYGRFPCFP